MGKIRIFWAIFGKDKEFQRRYWGFMAKRREIRSFRAKIVTELGEIPNISNEK